MAGLAIIHNTIMIIERWNEAISSVASATIGGSNRVGGHCGPFSGCVNTIVIIVTGFTRLYRWVNQAVVENTTRHFET